MATGENRLERWSDYAKRVIGGLLLLVGLGLLWRHFGALWRGAPEGHAAIWRVLLVSFALWVAPGVCWIRWGVKACPSQLEQLVLILASSVASSTLLIWILYGAGMYTLPVARALVVALAGAGLAAVPWRRLHAIPSRLVRSLASLSWLELLVLVFVAGFLLEITVHTVGVPLTSWDAIISWDKWACDMAERKGLGSYLMGGYPQLLPSLCSLAYKLSGTGMAGFPDEQLLMHDFAAPFAVLLVLALIQLCRLWGAPWASTLLLCLSVGSFQAWWRSGYVDIPATAMVMATLALWTSYARGSLAMRKRWVAMAWLGIMMYGAAFSKGYGLMWVLLVPVLVFIRCRSQVSFRAGGWSVIVGAIALAVLLVAPFYLHQRLLSAHLEKIEMSPRLHTFTVDVNKSAMYDRSGTAIRERVLEVLDGVGCATPSHPAVLPRAVQRVLLGAGVVTGACLSGGLAALALAMLAQWWVWDCTAAYDARNLLPAVVLLCILFSAGWHRLTACLGKGGPVVSVAVVLGMAWPWGVQEAHEVTACLKQIGAGESVKVWSVPADLRLRAVAAHQFLMRVILTQSPHGQRAPLIYLPDELYRHLGVRGVYTLKGNSFTQVAEGDLLIRNRNEPCSGDFTPVATLRLPGYESLSCCKPRLKPVPWSVASHQGVAVATNQSGLSVVGEGVLDLKIEPLLMAASGDSVIIAIQFGSPAEAAASSLEIPEAWDAITHIRTRVCPITDGAWIRAFVWLDRGEGFLDADAFERTVRVHVTGKAATTLTGIQAERLGSCSAAAGR